jgi:Cu(I)/Ag(I) efflux system membrane fusion protein
MVNITPERMKQGGVTTEVVTKRSLTRTLRAPARAEIDESALRDINIKAGAGYITKLYASYVGMSFRKGQPLMTVLCEGWLKTQIDYIKAYRAWKRTPLMSPNNSIALDNQLELMRARIRVWDLSEDQIARPGKIRAQHERNRSAHRAWPFRQLRCPGPVRRLCPHEEGRRGHALRCRTVAPRTGQWQGRVWIVAQFPEDQAMYVDVGQKMTVTFPSMPQHEVRGEINFIDPHVGESATPDRGPDRHPGRRPPVPSRPFRRGFG